MSRSNLPAQASETAPAKTAPAGSAASKSSAAESGWGARGYIWYGLVVTALLVFGLGTWSATAMLAGAVVAPGQIRVEAQRQVVQHPDGGVVGEILVDEGDVVEAGEVLVRLDGTTLGSELTVLESQLYEIMARRGRLEAEQAGTEEIEFDSDLLAAAEDDEGVAKLIQGQRELYAARAETLEREIELMQEREQQLREQIRGTEAEVASIERQAELIQQELVDQRTLFEKGLAQANRVLSLEREAARLEGRRAQLVSQIAQLRGQISEIAVERLRLEDDRREEAVAELREIGFRELELKERRLALIEKLSRLDVRAPRKGIVYDLAVHALQAVVRAAEPIVYIVPTDTALVVDARVDPIQIDQLYPGQDAVLRFSAFNARTTPTLSGTVANISADAFRDETTGAPYYLVEVVPDVQDLGKLGDQQLIPGMPVEVFIQTSERTALNYLVRPITDYFSRALREE